MSPKQSLMLMLFLLVIFAINVNAAPCYQPQFNESTVCGGLDTGTYNQTGVWWNDATFVLGNYLDGINSTSELCDSGQNCYYYISYAIPADTSSALWTVRTSDDIDDYGITSDCLSSTSLQLKTLSSNIGTCKSVYYCYDNAVDDYHYLGELYGAGNSGCVISEEEMVWEIGEETTTTTTESTTTTTVGTTTSTTSGTTTTTVFAAVLGNLSIPASVPMGGILTAQVQLTNTLGSFLEGQQCSVALYHFNSSILVWDFETSCLMDPQIVCTGSEPCTWQSLADCTATDSQGWYRFTHKIDESTNVRFQGVYDLVFTCNGEQTRGNFTVSRRLGPDMAEQEDLVQNYAGLIVIGVVGVFVLIAFVGLVLWLNGRGKTHHRS